ncbi:MAG: hypothetical protein RLP02_12235, partial [Coleofasciculus sp. C2-GNP5-27]
ILHITVTPPAPTTPAAIAKVAEQQVTAALDDAISQPGTTSEELFELVAQQASAVPESQLTAAIPATTPAAKQVFATCSISLEDIGAGMCRDSYAGDCASEFGSLLDNCFVAGVCHKTSGLCNGITPEMKAQLDHSVQVIQDWFDAHPGCSAYLDPSC